MGPIAPTKLQRKSARAWTIARHQHGVITRRQLLALGFTADAIRHRVAKGRLHPISRGVYALGRPDLTAKGRWMAAVLSCGPRAVLSHESAAALWQFRPPRTDRIEISVPAEVARCRKGVVLHRRPTLRPEDVTVRHFIPVTTVVCTLIDIAVGLESGQLEAAINEADKRDLMDPERLRAALETFPRRPGLGKLRKRLDHRTFALTDSELERRFLPIADRAGLAKPLTQQHVNGFKVDFYWPDLGLIVETDGLRYHRTPAQQARDRLRDQVHSTMGLTCLRFTRAQVRFEPDHVQNTLGAVSRRLQTSSDAGRSD